MIKRNIKKFSFSQLNISSYLIRIQDLTVLYIFNFTITRNIWISGIFTITIFVSLSIFKNFEIDRLGDTIYTFIRTLLGAITSNFLLLLLYPIIRNIIDHNIYIYFFLFTILAITVLHKLDSILIKKYERACRFLVIGAKNKYEAVLIEVKQKYYKNIEFVDYINPSKIVLLEKTKYCDAILVADDKLNELLNSNLDYLQSINIKIEYLSKFVEKNLNRLPIEVLVSFTEHYEKYFETPINEQIIHIFDLVLSIILIILFLPTVIIAMTLAKMEDGKELLFKQTRIGLKGRKYTLYKLRTMNRMNSSKSKKYVDVETKIGKVMRKYRINEIPQLINVLRGEMSLVGPRPDILETYWFCSQSIPFYNYRLKVRPGITGQAQIGYKYLDKLDKDIFCKRLEYDLHYIKNYNLTNYLRILLRTIRVIYSGQGK